MRVVARDRQVVRGDAVAIDHVEQREIAAVAHHDAAEMVFRLPGIGAPVPPLHHEKGAPVRREGGVAAAHIALGVGRQHGADLQRRRVEGDHAVIV